MADAALLRNLGRILLWGGAWMLAMLAYYIALAVHKGLLTVPLIGGALASVAGTIEKHIVEPLDELRKDAETDLVRGLSGLVDNLAIFVGLAALLGLGVKAALAYMWHHSLESRVVSWIEREIAKLHLPHLDVRAIEKAVEAQVVGLVTAPIATLRRDISRIEGTISRDLHAGVSEAERYADQAVSALRAAEDAAVAEAVRLAHGAEGDIAAAANAAVAAAEAIAVPIGRDINALDAYIKSLGLTSLVASIPLLATLVHTIATEAGLDSAECRAKNKAICATDPLQWAGLLAGLAALGLSFDLSDVVKLAAEGVGEAGNLLADVGQLPPDVVRSVGGVIGQVAAGIAA